MHDHCSGGCGRPPPARIAAWAKQGSPPCPPLLLELEGEREQGQRREAVLLLVRSPPEHPYYLPSPPPPPLPLPLRSHSRRPTASRPPVPGARRRRTGAAATTTTPGALSGAPWCSCCCYCCCSHSRVAPPQRRCCTPGWPPPARRPVAGGAVTPCWPGGPEDATGALGGVERTKTSPWRARGREREGGKKDDHDNGGS